MAYVDYYRITRNYLWFFWHFFAIPLHLKTLFIPWRRLSEDAGRHLDIERAFERMIVNTLMRIVGALVRLVFIALGIFVLGIAFLVFLIAGIVWTALPVMILHLFINGIVLLI